MSERKVVIPDFVFNDAHIKNDGSILLPVSTVTSYISHVGFAVATSDLSNDEKDAVTKILKGINFGLSELKA